MLVTRTSADVRDHRRVGSSQELERNKGVVTAGLVKALAVAYTLFTGADPEKICRGGTT